MTYRDLIKALTISTRPDDLDSEVIISDGKRLYAIEMVVRADEAFSTNDKRIVPIFNQEKWSPVW